MPHTVVIPEGLEYVGASLVGVIFLLLGQSQVVGKHRKQAKIAYPQLYAEKAQAEQSRDAHVFNCAQRASQQTLEQIPILLMMTSIAGLSYPIATASAIALWTVSRVSFTRGYISGHPKKRWTPLNYIGQGVLIGMLGASIYTTASWVLCGAK